MFVVKCFVSGVVNVECCFVVVFFDFVVLLAFEMVEPTFGVLPTINTPL